MTTFCTDIDLVHWEPAIAREAAFASQTLLSGTADLDGTSLTAIDAPFDFEEAQVRENQLVHLGPPFDGTYPIVKIDSGSELTLSVMYDGLFPTDGVAQAAPVGVATGVSFAVRTFWAQRAIVSELLLRACGLGPDLTSSILNPTALRRACTLGSLQMIYNALAAAAEEPAYYTVRADLYERLYRRALRNAVVELDLNNDGVADTRRSLNVLELRRS